MGKLGGPPTKGPPKEERRMVIKRLFNDRLCERERYLERPIAEATAAFNRAREWLIAELARNYRVDKRTSRRWVTEAVGNRMSPWHEKKKIGHNPLHRDSLIYRRGRTPSIL